MSEQWTNNQMTGVSGGAGSSDQGMNGGNNGEKENMCLAAFILGIVGFFLNPFYVVSILAIVFGAIGKDSTGPSAGKAKVGMILGIIAICIQIFIDILLGGIGICC